MVDPAAGHDGVGADRRLTPEGGRMTAERVLMALLLGGIGIGCVIVLYPFMSSLLWAAILAFTTWPVFEWLRAHLHLRRTPAAGLMVALTAVMVVLPLVIATPSAEDVGLMRRMIDAAVRAGLPTAPDWVDGIPFVGPTFAGIWDSWVGDISEMLQAMKPYVGIALEGGLDLLLGIARGVLLFILALFVAFFFYVYGEPIADRLTELLRRIAAERADRLIEVTGATVRGVVYGILGTAVVQGVLTAFGLWVSGVPRPVLLGTVAGFLAVLPVGPPLVWIPAALWLMVSGHLGWGVFLAVYGVVAVSGADSLIRPWFIARGAQLPFVLTVLGVIGGALGFGLLGIFLGPVLLGVGYTLVNEWATPEPTAPTVAPVGSTVAHPEEQPVRQPEKQDA
jgi:predicted PurR-regulated permease PerM